MGVPGTLLSWLLSRDLRLSKVKMLSFKAETRCLQEEPAITERPRLEEGIRGEKEGCGEKSVWCSWKEREENESIIYARIGHPGKSLLSDLLEPGVRGFKYEGLVTGVRLWCGWFE